MPAQAGWFAAHPGSALANVADNNIHAFNEFLRIACETGIMGLILFTVPVILALYYSIRGCRTSRYAGAGLLAILCFGVFSYPLSVELIAMTAILFFATIANDSATSALWSFRPTSGVKCLMFLLALSMLLYSGKEYVSTKRADRLLAEARHMPSALTGAMVKEAYARLRSNPEFVLCYCKFLINNELYTEALPVLEQASKLKSSSEVMCDLGICYQQAQRFHEAEQAFRMAADMAPAFIVPRYRLFKLYRETDNQSKAAETARRMLTMDVKVVNTSVLRIRNQARVFLKDSNHEVR